MIEVSPGTGMAPERYTGLLCWNWARSIRLKMMVSSCDTRTALRNVIIQFAFPSTSANGTCRCGCSTGQADGDHADLAYETLADVVQRQRPAVVPGV